MLLLAGCTGGGGDADEADADTPPTGLGTIQGVVVSAAIVPLPGANVTLLPDGPSVVTPDTGEFRFDGLAPGTHQVSVRLAGYVPQQVPATTGTTFARIVLEADTGAVRYVQAIGGEGFLERSANVAGARTASSQAPNYTFERTPDFVQIEMAWDSTQAFGDELDLTVLPLSGEAVVEAIGHAEGISPLVVRLNATALAAGNVGADIGIDLAVFAGQGEVAAGRGFGAALNQRFTVFTHVFYGFEPPEDWTFIEDGAPTVPP